MTDEGLTGRRRIVLHWVRGIRWHKTEAAPWRAVWLLVVQCSSWFAYVPCWPLGYVRDLYRERKR